MDMTMIFNFLYITIVIGNLKKANGFNIDTDFPTIKYGQDGSLFGFSVAEHHTATSPNSTTDMYLLAGAPTYSRLVNRRTGALYKCPITQLTEDCTRVDIEQKSANDGQWLGVEVVSQAPGKKVAVCAHRWKGNVDETSVNSAAVVDTLYGRCFVLDREVDSILDDEFPCERDANIRLSQYRYCQAGASVAFSAGDFIHYGSPGAYHWTGKLWSYDNNDNWFERTEKSSISHDSLSRKKVDIPNNSYVGFSLASGFIAERKPIVVTGAPRGNGTGLVLVYERASKNTNLTLIQVVHGKRFASAFGYSIALADIDGDDLHDLIVGAPQYYDPVSQHGGAVYIYTNDANGRFRSIPSRILYGSFDSAFGYAIAPLGDINIDGFNDFAVGSPQALSNNGSIYIFHGGSQPPENDHPAQIITSTTWLEKGLVKKPLSGFGISLSGGLDMDLNGYPDLLIGSLSDTVVLLRGKPIIDIHVSVTSTLSRLSFYVHDDLEARVFTMQVCMNYALRRGSVRGAIDLGYRITLDSASEYLVRRISFNESALESVVQSSTSLSSTINCFEMKLYIQRSVVDKLSPVTISIDYDLVSRDEASLKNVVTDDSKLVLMQNHPIIGAESDKSASLIINPSVQCGDDDICQSKIEFVAEYVENVHDYWTQVKPSPGGQQLPFLILGISKRIGVRITVENRGENAHQAKLRVLLPDGIHVVKVEPPAQNLAFANLSMAMIDLGNPFSANASTTFILEFSVDVSFREVDTITSVITIHTSSEQQDLDKPYLLQCLVRTEAFVEVLATSKPSKIVPTHFDDHKQLKNKPAREVGTLVTHTYEIINKGTVSVSDIEFELSWPTRLNGGDQWLLYYLGYIAQVSQRVSTSQIQCHVPESINPLELGYKGLRSKRETSGSKVENGGGGVMCPRYAGCMTINCTLYVLATGERMVIDVISVAWNETFIKEFGSKFYSVSVGSSFSIKKSAGSLHFTDRCVMSATATTEVVLESFFTTPAVNWLYVVGAIVGGVFLLAAIVLVVRRLGFFERNRVYQAMKHKQLSAAVDEEREEN